MVQKIAEETVKHSPQAAWLPLAKPRDINDIETEVNGSKEVSNRTAAI